MEHDWSKIGKYAAVVAAVLATLAGLFVLYRVLDPGSSPFFPRCIFHSITGLKCPGCGSQRAVHQLLNGNVVEAFRFNALLVVSIPYLAVYVIIRALETFVSLHGGAIKTKNPTVHQSDSGKFMYVLSKAERTLYHGVAVYVVLAAILLFWLLRNLIGF